MSDWGPVFVGVVLFILLTPGLLFQVPGRHKRIEFSNFHTSGASILVHSILYFALMCIFLLAVGVHMYIGYPERNRYVIISFCYLLLFIRFMILNLFYTKTRGENQGIVLKRGPRIACF